jgi:hypothetical protein
MRTSALVLITVGTMIIMDPRPSAAEVYRPWCVQYTGRDGGTNCGFTSYQQCMMTATPGSGAICVRNPWYEYYGDRSPSRQSVRQRTR